MTALPTPDPQVTDQEPTCTCSRRCPDCGGTRPSTHFHMTVQPGPFAPDALRQAFSRMWMGEKTQRC